MKRQNPDPGHGNLIYRKNRVHNPCHIYSHLYFWAKVVTPVQSNSNEVTSFGISWGFQGFSSAIRLIPGDLYTARRIISLSLLSLATDVTNATLGEYGLWLGTRTGAGGTATLTESFFFGRTHGFMGNRFFIWKLRVS